MACIKGAKAIDTTMGLTPLEGLVMGSRSGDIDPAIIFHLAEQGLLDYPKIREALEKKSGLIGLSGVSRDMRDVESAAAGGNEHAQTALNVFAHRARKYVGAFLAETRSLRRHRLHRGDWRERRVDAPGDPGKPRAPRHSSGSERHREARGEACISAADSKVAVLVVPTNEELMIARDTIRLINQPVSAQR